MQYSRKVEFCKVTFSPLEFWNIFLFRLRTPLRMINRLNFFSSTWTLPSSRPWEHTCFSSYSLRSCTRQAALCTVTTSRGRTLSQAFLAKGDIPGFCHKTLYEFCRIKLFPLKEMMLRKSISFFVHRNILCTNEVLSLIKIMNTAPCLFKFSHKWSSTYKMSSPINFFSPHYYGQKIENSDLSIFKPIFWPHHYGQKIENSDLSIFKPIFWPINFQVDSVKAKSKTQSWYPQTSFIPIFLNNFWRA